ncbi:ABC transporter permease [Pseudofrankia asymbiotica]|uniref:Uncharacterized protein n=1 Tax=Pseudofrankia asymbiotica TaxID=1834516 RepID=A0A1V2HZH0_9ACTN|nr:ABC transporter permease [Pseudofrankia asymbiotica]ONH22126.1 hypothetical protein BL253_36710 [Pseudofrankia asymbiotica]
MEPTIVLLLAILLVVALIAPRLRARSLVPIVCILLGWYWSGLGFTATLAEIGHRIQNFVQSLPIQF